MAEIQSPIIGGIGAARNAVSPEIVSSLLRKTEENNALLRAQGSALNSIASGLTNIRDRFFGLDVSLKSISKQITSDSFLEKQRLTQEAEQERILAQQRLREGKESAIEKKIQATLLDPVQKIGNTAKSILSRLAEFFTTIIAGWLLNQGLEALKANAEGSKEKLIEIRDNVLKTLGIIGGIFLGVRYGLGALIRGVGGLTAKIIGAIANNLFKKPFQMVATAAAGALGLGAGRKPPAAPPPGPKPRGGGGFLGLTGKLATVASGLMNWANGENMDAVLVAASMIGPLRFIRVAAGLGFAADELAELFGLNIFGKDPKKLKQAREIKEAAEKEAKANPKPAPAQVQAPSKPSSPSAAPAAEPMAQPSAPTAQPQTPLMATSAKPSGQEASNQSGTSAPSITIQSSGTSQAPTPTPTTSSFPDYSSVFSSGSTSQSVTPQEPIIPTQPKVQISNNYSQMSMEQLRKMLDPTKTGASNPAVFAAASAARAQGQAQGLTGEALEKQVLIATIEASKGSPSGASPITQAQISPTASVNLPNTIQSVGPAPEPPTNVVVAPSTQQSGGQPNISPSASGSVNDVPGFPTSNPDNFYLLYSQVQYNIVSMG